MMENYWEAVQDDKQAAEQVQTLKVINFLLLMG